MQNVSVLWGANAGMSEIPDQAIADLAIIRRHTLSAIASIDRLFRALKPVCQRCLHNQGLVTECRCRSTEVRLTIR